MYFHDELKLLLVIYVDDLKLCWALRKSGQGLGNAAHSFAHWTRNRPGLYLGCVLSQGETQLHNGKKVKTITYNMEGLLKLSVEKYLDIIGKDTKLKKVSTPSLPEETKKQPISSSFRREAQSWVSLVCTFLRSRDACSPRDWQLTSWPRQWVTEPRESSSACS